LGCTTNQRIIQFGYVVHVLCQRLSVFPGVPSVCTRDAGEPEDCGSEVFIAEEFDGVGHKGSGDTTTVDVEAVLEAFLGNLWI
jgi:hypothetical protein